MDDNELKHVGVLGMKWGVRRGSSGGGSRATQNGIKSRKDILMHPPGRALSRKERRYAKDVAIAKVRRAQTKEFIKYMAKTNKDKSPERQKKEKEFWENFLKDDLNATPESVSGERRRIAATLVAGGLAIVGMATLNSALSGYK